MKSELSITRPSSATPDGPTLSAAQWSGAGWALALAAVLVLLVGAALPPFVGPEVRGVLRAGFGPLCHQLPERSFAVGGVPFAVCHRCTGIVAGLAAGVLLLPLTRVPEVRARAAPFAGARFAEERVWLLAAVLPAALDWSGDLLGLWVNTAGTRVATGAWFGLVVGLVFARALALRGRPVEP